VSIELQGPVSDQAFKDFYKVLSKAIKDMGDLTDPPNNPPGSVKLKAKKTKAETKPKP
jgi:hypothetical protein